MIETIIKVGQLRPEFMTDLPPVLGKEIEILMPNGEKHKGQFAIVDLDRILASHDPENFSDTPGYPVNEFGRNINDRNYKDDISAQRAVMDYAIDLQPERIITNSRTPSGTPIITVDGIVVSGNNRVMSSKYCKDHYNYLWGKYRQFMFDELDVFGIDKSVLAKSDMEQPYLVRIDYDFAEYTTQEMMKYNKDTKKSERPIDKAIKLSNVLRENKRCSDVIAEITGQFETFTDFYSSVKDQKRLAYTLVECDILTNQEIPAYFTGNDFTTTGKELIENLLAALILDRDALFSSEQPGVLNIKRKILTALPVLMKNATLPEGSLKQNINDAVILQYKIQASGLEFADFIRQYNIFDERYDKRTVYVNRLLNLGKLQFKEAFEKYNNSVESSQGASLFGEKPSLDEIFDKFITQKIDATEIRLIESSQIIKAMPKEIIAEPEKKVFSIANDDFFQQNPEKMLGQPYEASGRFGKVTKYKGDISALDKIDTPDNFSASEIMGGAMSSNAGKDLETDVKTGEIAVDAVEKAIEESPIMQAEKKRKKITELKTYDEPVAETELLSFSEILQKYNPNISTEEMKVFLWYKHQQGQTMKGEWLNIFNPASLTQDQESAFVNKWVNDGLLCYFESKLIPSFLYYAENIYQRKDTLLSEKDQILEIYGQDVYNRQLEGLERLVSELLTGRLRLNDPDETKRLRILPVSDFAKSFKIATLADELPFEMRGSKKQANYGEGDFLYDLNGYVRWGDKKTFTEFSIYEAFMYWLNKYRSEIQFKKSTWVDIIKFYLWKIQYNEDRDGNRANYERKKASAREDGDRLFSFFLAEVIKEEDRLEIEKQWNDKYNGYKRVDYDKVPIGFRCAKFYPGDDLMDIRYEKREAVAFSFIEGSGLLAYQVGLGKTWSAIFIMAQFMEAGYCKRPFLVVPNQTYKQWISEIKGILPHIKINDLYNLSQDYVDELTGKEGIQAVEEGSISILTEEGFRRIGFSEFTASKLEVELMEILLQQVPGEDDKKTQRQQEGFRAKLQTLIGKGLKKSLIEIESLGFDFMVVDEAHSMKKIFTSVVARANKREGKEIKQKDYEIQAGTASTLGLKGFMISYFISQSNGFKNILCLTATPFTNSPLEVYSMLALVGYQKLKDLGINNLNDFFDIYCQVSYDLVVNAKLKPERRQIFLGFNNLVSLQQLIFRFMNYKEAGKPDEKGNMVELIRPDKYVLPYKSKIVDGQRVMLPSEDQIGTYLPLSAKQQEMMDNIIAYVEGHMEFEDLKTVSRQMDLNLEDAAKDEDETIDTTEGIELDEVSLSEKEKAGVRMLRGVNFARSLALSPYLYEHSGLGEPDYKNYIETSPKLTYVIECIKTIRKHHTDGKQPMSGIVIYMDRGKKYFELIRDYLVKEIGYKEHEIGIIKSGMSSDEIKKVSKGYGQSISGQKEYKDFIKNRFLGVNFNEATKMFEDVPDDQRMKVLIGSSSIKEGMNLQRHSTVLFNCFLEWNPTDVVQLEGRIWRQGNRYKAVRIVNPLMEDSMDIFMFQKLEEKTSRINAIWNYDGKTNVLSTDEFDPKELKYQLIKDPRVIAEMQIEEIKEGITDEIGALNYEKNILSKISDAVYIIDSRTEDLKKLIAKFAPGQEKKSLSVMIAVFEKMVKDQADASGKSFKEWKNILQYDYYTYGIDYGGTFSKPRWFKDLKGAISQMAKYKKEFLDPNNIVADEKGLERYRQKINDKIEAKEKAISDMKKEDAVSVRIAEIMEERRNMDYKPASLEERVMEFKKLNYLLDQVRATTEGAEAFKRIEHDMCPPISPNGERLIDKASIDMLERCIKNLPQTKDMHTISGTDTYTPEREKLHRNIINKFRSGAVCQIQQQPIAILTGGVPGSGKSTYLKKYAEYLKSDKILTIDADKIREMLPENQGWNSAVTHREAKDIYMKMFEDIQEGKPCKYDILWDGTMNKTRNYIPMIKKIKELGYRVYIIFLDVPYEVSLKRVLERYQHTGRYVPRAVIEDANKAGLSAFNTIKEMVDGWLLVDGITHEVKERHGEEIPKDRHYFDKPFSEKDKKVKIAKAKAAAQAQEIELLKLKLELLGEKKEENKDEWAKKLDLKVGDKIAYRKEEGPGYRRPASEIIELNEVGAVMKERIQNTDNIYTESWDRLEKFIKSGHFKLIKSKQKSQDFKKKIIIDSSEYKVYLVDGEALRNSGFIEFVEGGNHYVDAEKPGSEQKYAKYIGADEIWVDEIFKDKPDDLYAIILHEIVEKYLMSELGMDYETAHDISNQAENEFREKIPYKDKQRTNEYRRIYEKYKSKYINT